jgi:acyl dehydratase
MDAQAAVDKVQDLIGQEVGVSDWLTVDQERVNKFAECTEDFQWIHLDEEKAAKGPFGKTIAHGFLTLSLLPKLGSSVRLPALKELNTVMGVNYGLNKVRFINPVPVGSKVRARVSLKDAVAKSPERILFTYSYVFEIEGEEKPACIAESLGLTVLKPD